MPTILIIVGHADADSFTHALAHRYERAAAEAGVHTEWLELSSLRFSLVLHSARAQQPLEPDLQRARQTIVRADHVAWFFPTWWAAPPALVKGFVDRTFTPGFAYRYEAGRALQHKLLRGRSARLVTSMDAPWWWYALFYRSALHASFVQATLRFVGFAPVRCTTVYGLRNATAARRERILQRVARDGASDAGRLRARPLLASQTTSEQPG